MSTYQMPPESAKLAFRLNRRCRANPSAWAYLCWVVSSTLAFWALGIDRPVPKAPRSAGGHQRVSPHLVGERRRSTPPGGSRSASIRVPLSSEKAKTHLRERPEKRGERNGVTGDERCGSCEGWRPHCSPQEGAAAAGLAATSSTFSTRATTPSSSTAPSRHNNSDHVTA
jgi:hypothetical protein